MVRVLWALLAVPKAHDLVGFSSNQVEKLFPHFSASKLHDEQK